MNRALLAAVLLLALVLSGCGEKPVSGKPTPRVTERPPASSGRPGSPSPAAPLYPEGKELLASADTEEEARELAELYGIELVSFEYRVAVFHTEEDPFDVIQRGKDNDWPPLEINHIRRMFTNP